MLISRDPGVSSGSVVVPPTTLSYGCLAGLGVGDAVYVSGTDAVAAASASAPGTGPCVGFVKSKPTSTTAEVAYQGELGGFSSLTPGATYYLGTTAGHVTSDPSSVPSGGALQRVGYAKNPTTLVIEVDRDVVLR